MRAQDWDSAPETMSSTGEGLGIDTLAVDTEGSQRYAVALRWKLSITRG